MRSFSIIALALVFSASVATAQEASNSHRAAAHRLFEVMQIEQGMVDGATTVFKQMQAPPQVIEAMTGFMAEILNWETLEPQITEMYVGRFSETELKELTAFYLTPVGQKMVTAQPEISGEMMAITQKIMAENQGRLMQLMQAASTKQ